MSGYKSKEFLQIRHSFKIKGVHHHVPIFLMVPVSALDTAKQVNNNFGRYQIQKADKGPTTELKKEEI